MTMVPEKAVGQRAKSDPVVVTAEEILAFAEATSDDNPRFCDPGREDLIAPPIYTARYLNPLYLKILSMAGANFARVVFGEMDYRYHRPISAGQRVVAEIETTALEDKASGQLLRARGVLKSADDGELLVEGLPSFFVRGERKGPKAAKPEPPPLPAEAFVVQLETREDQPTLFAKIANDPNPIHLDDRLAKAAGLGGVIMHGLCSMAFCGRAVLDRLCEGDPSRLERLAVRFSKPARPGKPLTIRVFEPAPGEASGTYRFIAENDAGLPVITGGVAETLSRQEE